MRILSSSRRSRSVAFVGVAAVAIWAVGSPVLADQPPSGDLIEWGASGTFPQPVPTALPGLGSLAGKAVTSFDVGLTAGCAVADGRVHCWGSGPVGTLPSPTPVPVNTSGVLAGKTVTSVSVGSSVACAVADGRAYCWGNGQVGDGSYGSMLPVAVDTSGALAGKTVQAVSVADDDMGTLACTVADGRLYCWGSLGIGAGAATPYAVDPGGVLTGKTVTAVSAGGIRTCVIADAKAYCTNNSMTFEPVSSDVLAGRPVASVAVGEGHACLLADGRVHCWGENSHGQLGTGSLTDSATPVPVDTSGVLAGQDVQAVAAGRDHTCALANGRVYCWGENMFGQLGIGMRSRSLVPAAVAAPLSATGPAVSVLSAAVTSTCAAGSGAVYCWGWGLAPPLVRHGEAYQVSGLAGLTKIEGSCGIIDGHVYCWDGYAVGEPVIETPGPVAVQGLPRGRASELTTGGGHACAVVKGRAYCWGSNSYGELGNGTRKASTKAVRVTSKGAWGSQPVSSISAGRTHTCAVAAGKAYCWGTGDLGRPSVKRSSTPVRVPLAAKRVTAISAGPAEWVYEKPQDEVDKFTGRTDTCAVASGRLFCWGWNTYGQLGIGNRRSTATPRPVTGGAMQGKRVSAVSLGGSPVRACAIAGGRAYCWGTGGLGVSGRTSSNVPVKVKGLPDKSVTELAAGTGCALVSGAIWCWGGSGSALPHRVDLSGLDMPGLVVDISQVDRQGIWRTT